MQPITPSFITFIFSSSTLLLYLTALSHCNGPHLFQYTDSIHCLLFFQVFLTICNVLVLSPPPYFIDIYYRSDCRYISIAITRNLLYHLISDHLCLCFCLILFSSFGCSAVAISFYFVLLRSRHFTQK